MDRKYMIDLKIWLDSEIRKPLIVYGARQTGKTYLVRDMFAKKYFDNKYIYVDCSMDKDFVEYCTSNLNPKDIINYLSLEYDMIIDKNTLLIFDEVQECLPIITALKYFCQDYNEIPIIVTGSMVRIKLSREVRKRGRKNNNKFLFPLGKINELYIYPLDFDEYLYNRNKILYNSLEECYKKKMRVDDVIHNKALKIFYEYLLIGGLPEVVDTFLKTKNYQMAKEVLRNLYNNYLDDMILYQISSETVIRTKKIFENIFSQLNKENKNFKCSIVEKGLKNRDLKSPIDWLEESFLVQKSMLLKEHITIPLVESNESLYRLYLADIGIFSYQSRVLATSFIDNNKTNTLSGIFFENFIANSLSYNGYKLFYWKGKNNAEFEFIIESNGIIYPIDVKKSRGNLNSLEKYKEHNEVNFVVKVSKNNYGYDDKTKILTIPFYEFFLFIKELKENENKNLLIL